MSNELLWYTSRASGVVSVVLLTGVVVLGLVVSSRRPPRPARAAVVMGLHRSLSLGLLAFLVLHVATAVAETYVAIDLVSAVVPFTSGFSPFWVGLGTTAFDLVLAVTASSLLRHRLPERLWRWLHTTTYVLWPLAVLHGLVLGTSAETGLRLVTAGCGVVGVAVGAWRLLAVDPHARVRQDIAAEEWR